MKKEVKDGNPIPAQKSTLTTTEGEVLKTPIPAANYLVKTNANLQSALPSAAAARKEPTAELFGEVPGR